MRIGPSAVKGATPSWTPSGPLWDTQRRLQASPARRTAATPALFDRRGNVVIPARFDFAERFSEGMAAVCQGCRRIDRGEHWSMEGGEWCFINRAGALNIRLRFDAAQSFAKGRARVRIAGVRRYIGRNGRLAAP